MIHIEERTSAHCDRSLVLDDWPTASGGVSPREITTIGADVLTNDGSLKVEGRTFVRCDHSLSLDDWRRPSRDMSLRKPRVFIGPLPAISLIGSELTRITTFRSFSGLADAVQGCLHGRRFFGSRGGHARVSRPFALL